MIVDLTQFYSKFRATGSIPNAPVPPAIAKRVGPDFVAIIQELGGKIFNDGLYRVYTGAQIEKMTAIICEQFDSVKGQAFAFAADWMGRQFVIDFTEIVDGQPTVECFDSATPESFATDQAIIQFHNDSMVNMTDATVDEERFLEWMEQTKTPLAHDQCVGYNRPIFMGGDADFSNMDVTDIEVHITICGQLWREIQAKKKKAR